MLQKTSFCSPVPSLGASSTFHGVNRPRWQVPCNRITTQHLRHVVVPTTKRINVRMLGPFFPNLGDSKLLKSEIVRREKETLEQDYFELAKLGQRYEVCYWYYVPLSSPRLTIYRMLQPHRNLQISKHFANTSSLLRSIAHFFWHST